jgi:short-subunit dehydrogenase
MSVLIISRTEARLQEQEAELRQRYGGAGSKQSFAHLAYDFTDPGPAKAAFYALLDAKCKEMDADGGLGLLINNVGTANEIPMELMEFSDKAIEDMIHCNVFSTINMSRAVLPYMQARRNGAVVCISSGSGNGPTPMLTVYSATK